MSEYSTAFIKYWNSKTSPKQKRTYNEKEMSRIYEKAQIDAPSILESEKEYFFDFKEQWEKERGLYELK